jgi:GMP synthase PP-ATPase subunit
VRILGEIHKSRADILRRADAKFIEELRALGLVTATREGRQQLHRINADVLADILHPTHWCLGLN